MFSFSRKHFWSGLVLLLLLAGCTESEPPAGLLFDVPFQHVVIDASPNSGEDCCTDVAALGDINGDGFLDVVLGAEGATADGLVWYEYPDWTKHAIGDGDFTTDGETADVDGDGDTDVVISDIARDAVEWWENGGDPAGPENWTRHEIGQTFVHDLAVGDVNGDGRPDVIVKEKGATLSWFAAPSDPTQLWAQQVIDTPAGEGLDAGDVDGDGDLDVAASHFWYENVDGAGGSWQQHDVAAAWGEDARAIISDMNGDGRADIVLSHSEGKGPLSWFEGPDWAEHAIETETLEGAHSLEVADFDGDGDPDVFTGEMHTSSKKRVLLYQNLGDDAWNRIVLGTSGTHNARVGDVDGDGDPDIVGKNYGGTERVVEIWENFSAETTSAANWEYVALDDSRPESQMGKMGLVFSDVTGDGRPDIIAGSYLYANPGGDLHDAWPRSELPDNVDVYFAPDVDGDANSDLVGIADNELVWIEATDAQGNGWAATTIGTVPEGRTQGYTAAQIVPGGRPELVFTRAKNLFYLEIPEAGAENGTWPLTQISDTNEEEGVAAGDLDDDGDLDLAVQDADGHHTMWLENPGDGSGTWARHVVGESREWLDRIALVDVNGDGRLDLVTGEETPDWTFNARLYWFEAPAGATDGAWTRHTIDILRSINSMDVADMDGDGDVDIVAAEHTDQSDRPGTPDNLTLWYENQDGGARWVRHVIEIGNHSSHLGARLIDLDGDGDLDVVSIAWQQFKWLHLWLNEG